MLIAGLRVCLRARPASPPDGSTNHRPARASHVGLASLLIAGGVLVGLGARPSRALAHGRPLGVVQLQILSDGRVATFTTRGPVLEQRAPGEEPDFPWTCSQGYGDMGQVFIPHLATDDEGTLLAATLAGIYRRSATGCVWEQATDPALRFVTVGDVFASAADVGGDGRFYAVTAEPIPTNTVARSDDRGATWITTEVTDARLQSVRDAPSNEDVVVAAGFRDSGETLAGVLLRSVDRGATFDPMGVPFVDGELTLVVDAIAPDDPDLALLRTVTNRREEAPEERLLLLRGGELTELLRARQVRGVVAGPGGQAWVITQTELLRLDGLHDVDDMTGGGGLEVITLATAAYTAIAFRDGTMVAGPELVQDDVTMVVQLETQTGAVSETINAYTDVVESDRCDDAATDSVCQRDLDDVIRDSGLLLPPPPPEPMGGGCAVQWAPDDGPSRPWLLLLVATGYIHIRRRGQHEHR